MKPLKLDSPCLGGLVPLAVWAEDFGVTLRSVQHYRKAGLPVYQLGKRLLVDPPEAIAWLKGKRVSKPRLDLPRAQDRLEGDHPRIEQRPVEEHVKRRRGRPRIYA